MFVINEKLKIVNINQDYLKTLYDADHQVFYVPKNYESKPYLGIMINDKNGNKYIAPLTSAKEKHKDFKNYDYGKLLIFENVDKSKMGTNDIWKENEDGTAKHILSVLYITKMLPVKEGTYTEVNINHKSTDSKEDHKYKDLLNKEYSFCISKKEKIIKEATKIYDKQMKKGHPMAKSEVNFKKLEKAMKKYKIKN